MRKIEIKFALEAERPFVIFQTEDNSFTDVFNLGQIDHTIYDLFGKLKGVIRSVRAGHALPEMIVTFHHNHSACVELTIRPTPVNSDAEIEFREFPTSSAQGWRDPKHSQYRLLHATTMTPSELADLLHDTLKKLVDARLKHLYETDKTMLKMTIEAMEVYEREGQNLAWPKVVQKQLLPVAQPESDRSSLV